jgi:1-acyl-sn-glycerol-3-phosphate acyltransferase
VVGAERIPAKGGALLIANHYNSIVDPLILQASLPRWVTFCAAEFLFRGPLGGFMRRLGMIPIFRSSDRHDPTKNLESFRRCFEAFEEGRVVAIFPEGVSHNESHLLKLKSGAARIFFGAHEHHRAKGAGPLALALIPVGLVFEAKSRFQSRVTVVVGAPIDPTLWLAMATEKPQRATRELTNQLQHALERETFSQESWDDYRFVDRLTQLCAGARAELGLPADEETSPEREIALRRSIRDTFLELSERDPQALRPLRTLVTTHCATLERLGITDRHVRENHTPRKIARFVLRHLETTALGWPLALYGIANNGLGYLAVKTGARLLSPRGLDGKPREDQQSTVKIYHGTAIFVVIMLVQTALVTWACTARGWPAWFGVLYFLSLPVSGWYATGFLERRRQAHQSAWAFALLKTRARLRDALRQRRARILDELRKIMDQAKVPNSEKSTPLSP